MENDPSTNDLLRQLTGEVHQLRAEMAGMRQQMARANRKPLWKRVVEYGTLGIMGYAGLDILATFSPIAKVAFGVFDGVLSFALGNPIGWALCGAATVALVLHERERKGKSVPKWYRDLKRTLGLRERGAPDDGRGVAQREVGEHADAYRPGIVGRVQKMIDAERGRVRVAVPENRRVGVSGRPQRPVVTPGPATPARAQGARRPVQAPPAAAARPAQQPQTRSGGGVPGFGDL